MRYEWLAHHLVRRRFPDLHKRVQDEIISEAVCRAWCTFRAPDYRLMQTCITAVAKRKGLSLTPGGRHGGAQDRADPGTGMPQVADVIHLSDYRRG